MWHGPDVPHRVGVRIHEAVTEWRVVDVSIEVDDVDRPIPGPYHRRAHRMVSTEYDRHRPRREDRADSRRGVVPGPLGIGRLDVDIADINDPPVDQFVLQVATVVATIVVAVRPESERMFADVPRSQAGSRQVR